MHYTQTTLPMPLTSNQKQTIKKTQKKTIFSNSVKYIWIGPESCNIVFFCLFVFFCFCGFLLILLVLLAFSSFVCFFCLFLVKFVSPGCEGVVLCIQECGPCVIVYSGMGAWECVEHEKVHSHSVPFCMYIYIYIYIYLFICLLIYLFIPIDRNQQICGTPFRDLS